MWLLCAWCIQINSCFSNIRSIVLKRFTLHNGRCNMHWRKFYEAMIRREWCSSSLFSTSSKSWKFVVTANHQQGTNAYFSVQFGCFEWWSWLLLLLLTKCILIRSKRAKRAHSSQKLPLFFIEHIKWTHTQTNINARSHRLFLSLVQFLQCN